MQKALSRVFSPSPLSPSCNYADAVVSSTVVSSALASEVAEAELCAEVSFVSELSPEPPQAASEAVIRVLIKLLLIFSRLIPPDNYAF